MPSVTLPRNRGQKPRLEMGQDSHFVPQACGGRALLSGLCFTVELNYVKATRSKQSLASPKHVLKVSTNRFHMQTRGDLHLKHLNINQTVT
jgi:hypothetical protein